MGDCFIFIVFRDPTIAMLEAVDENFSFFGNLCGDESI
jgi:hypothetical protein